MVKKVERGLGSVLEVTGSFKIIDVVGRGCGGYERCV